MSISLIGLPGSGKSTLGRALAQRLELPFVDMDQWIEQKSRASIAELFTRGEAVFRRWEQRAVRALAPEDIVLSCGGGVVTREDNQAPLRAGGLVVWIDRPVECILRDVEIHSRPLLAGGSDRLWAVERERGPLYRAWAHVRVDNALDATAALDALYGAVRAWQARQSSSTN